MSAAQTVLATTGLSNNNESYDHQASYESRHHDFLLEKRGELFERLVIGLIVSLKPVGCGTRLEHIPAFPRHAHNFPHSKFQRTNIY